MTTSVATAIDNATLTFRRDDMAVSTGTITFEYATTINGVTTTAVETVPMGINGNYLVVGRDTFLTTGTGGLVFIKDLTPTSLILQVVDLGPNMGVDFLEGQTDYTFVKLPEL